MMNTVDPKTQKCGLKKIHCKKFFSQVLAIADMWPLTQVLHTQVPTPSKLGYAVTVDDAQKEKSQIKLETSLHVKSQWQHLSKIFL
jgi:hypothetical protein